MSTSAARMRSLRSRQKHGQIWLTVEVDEDRLQRFLLRRNMIKPGECEDRDALNAGASRLIDIATLEDDESNE
jgi:hypothetical protein